MWRGCLKGVHAWRQERLEGVDPGARHELIAVADDEGDGGHTKPRARHLIRSRVGVGVRVGG